VKLLRRDVPFSLPIKFIQFGEGNFLRAYVDWMIDLLNERVGLNAGVVVVRPRGYTVKPLLDVQDGLFTTLIQGLNEHGEAVKEYRKITCVQRELNPITMYADFLALARNPDTRFVVSNTTEAGIAVNDSDRFDDAPPAAFPAKLTRLLYERFRHFDGARDRGWLLLPCELIDHNGPTLKAAVLHFSTRWNLGAGFGAWLDQANVFCSTLVDRIVTGYPAEGTAAIEAELGYRDQFLVAAEYYYAMIVEGPSWLADELKLHGANLNIRLVGDLRPYRQAKVGILNGGHTTLVPVALLAGVESVAEAVDDPDIGRFLRDALAQEIVPALPLPREAMEMFAAEVLRRFRNPYIHHRLASIALNSWPKFATRVMPQLQRYAEIFGRLPQRLVLALAATMLLYRGDVIELSDDEQTLAWFKSSWREVMQGRCPLRDLVAEWLATTAVWGRDVGGTAGLVDAVAAAVVAVHRHGIRTVIKTLQ
jgi:tagaturonate reductase